MIGGQARRAANGVPGSILAVLLHGLRPHRRNGRGLARKPTADRLGSRWRDGANQSEKISPCLAAEGLYASISALGLAAGSGYYRMARAQLVPASSVRGLVV